jgi:cobaltochelatase CobN
MILFLTHADTDLLTLSFVVPTLPSGFPRVLGANLRDLEPPEILDRFIRQELNRTKVILLRLLGGKRSFEAGFDRLIRWCRERGLAFIPVPGDWELDPELLASATVPEEVGHATFKYLVHGGVKNFANLLLFLSNRLLETNYPCLPPEPLPWEGVYHPQEPEGIALEDYLVRRIHPARLTVGLLFYRAHWMSRNLAFVDALIRTLEPEANVLPLFCYSLKGDNTGNMSRVFHDYLLDQDGRSRVDCLVTTVSFSMASVSPAEGGTSQASGPALATGWSVTALDTLNVPIIQAIVATSSYQRWHESERGLGPLDVAMNVAMPEFDGRIITVPVSFKEVIERDRILGTLLTRYVPKPDRVSLVARLALNWARLRRKPNSEKRLAFILTNYPSKNARIGNAVGLDTPASVIKILHALSEAGYRVENIPQNGNALIEQLIARGCNDRDFATPDQWRDAASHVNKAQYADWFAALAPSVQRKMQDHWGDPPGEVLCTNETLLIPGLHLGNIFIGLQPSRGYGDNPVAVFHSPDLVPTHHYLAYYHWLRDVFHADAVVHVGKHGTLEWLPGKSIGLSQECYPEVILSDLPHFYPYIVNNPGEGTQAKRRAHAVLVDHLIPAMTTADAYGDIARLEQLLDEYYQVQTLDPKKIPLLRQQIWQVIVEAKFHRDLGRDEPPEDFDGFLQEMDGYLCELKDAQIRDGLHILGEPPQGEQLIDLLLALTRLDNLRGPSLRTTLAHTLGLDHAALLEDRGKPLTVAPPALLVALKPDSPLRSQGELLKRLNELARRLLVRLQEENFRTESIATVVQATLGRQDPAVEQVLMYLATELYPNLLRTTDEINNLLRGFAGEYVPAGPSGSPTRGMANVLPTGRNFYSVDPQAIPSPAAWEIGKQIGQQVLDKYLAEEGRYPESVGIVVWGTSAMRTHGDDIAEILFLLGVRPVWQPENRRIRGVAAIPIAELHRPRIDVTVRLSGFFRDAFPNLVHLLDEAITLVAGLDESPQDNYIVKHLQDDLARGVPYTRALFRLFGSKPGAYGAGILPAIHNRNWETDRDLADVYMTWGSYAYTRTSYGEAARGEFQLRFRQIAIAVKNQDNREHDIFDSDDYLQYHGGMIATVRALTGHNPKAFFGDTANPTHTRVRDLTDEARRVFRSRVINPKWLASIKRHGYKGASELAATVEYLFGYDATAGLIEDWMYERLTQVYVLDAEMQNFFMQHNPWALHDISAKLLEAIARQLWEQPNPETFSRLRQIYLNMEAGLEAKQEEVKKS